MRNVLRTHQNCKVREPRDNLVSRQLDQGVWGGVGHAAPRAVQQRHVRKSEPDITNTVEWRKRLRLGWTRVYVREVPYRTGVMCSLHTVDLTTHTYKTTPILSCIAILSCIVLSQFPCERRLRHFDHVLCYDLKPCNGNPVILHYILGGSHARCTNTKASYYF